MEENRNRVIKKSRSHRHNVVKTVVLLFILILIALENENEVCSQFWASNFGLLQQNIGC